MLPPATAAGAGGGIPVPAPQQFLYNFLQDRRYLLFSQKSCCDASRFWTRLWGWSGSWNGTILQRCMDLMPCSWPCRHRQAPLYYKSHQGRFLLLPNLCDWILCVCRINCYPDTWRIVEQVCTPDLASYRKPQFIWTLNFFFFLLWLLSIDCEGFKRPDLRRACRVSLLFWLW